MSFVEYLDGDKHCVIQFSVETGRGRCEVNASINNGLPLRANVTDMTVICSNGGAARKVRKCCDLRPPKTSNIFQALTKAPW